MMKKKKLIRCASLRYERENRRVKERMCAMCDDAD